MFDPPSILVCTTLIFFCIPQMNKYLMSDEGEEFDGNVNNKRSVSFLPTMYGV